MRWRWAPGLFSLLLLLGLAWYGLLQPAEQWLYRQTLNHFAPEIENKQVALLTVERDAASQQRLARALEHLGGARAVGVLLPLAEAENTQALSLLKQRVAQQEEAGKKAAAEPLATLRRLVEELDHPARLSDALQEHGAVILGVRYETRRDHPPREVRPGIGAVAPARIPYLDRFPTVIAPFLSRAAVGGAPYPEFAEAARGLGYYGGDTVSFPAVLAEEKGGGASLLLQLLRLAQDAFDAKELALNADGRLTLGALQLAVDRGFRLYPFARLDGGMDKLQPLPLAAVAAGEFAPGRFHDKTVLIGERGDPALARQARAVEAALQQQLVRVPQWSVWGQLGALLLSTLLLVVVLPRMGYSAAAVTMLLMTLLLVNGEFLLLLLGRQWLPLTLPLLLMWLGYPLITFRRFLALRQEQLASELSAANRQLGRMLQSQGELEQALEKYRRCRVDGELLEQLYHLGLDFERKRQFAKAVSLFQYLDSLQGGFRDVAERIRRNQSMEQRIVLAKGGGASSDGTVIMSSEGLQNPTVGHYQIERELGRGAMGMVYLGKDPRIGRSVAIKTMAFSSEFEGAQLEEVKQRFYREAETAGRLNHPNIVHVYDIGEEQELAYIAMDYLQGEHLGKYTSADSLLPIKEVLGIAEQVAEALAYAHKQNVVHRDIKPANIIYDSEAGAVKVTDFGVACLTDASKTKTGTVLGSPSYMSPEQVAGKRVDGRADIFSLGVTLYQMLTGHLPFEADSLGSLMYKIANEPHPKPSKYRKGIPICASRIVNKCMQKDPAKRYQSGEALAAALKRCRGK
jgi:hypothetical protein